MSLGQINNKTYEELLGEWNNQIVQLLIVEDVFLCSYLLFGTVGNILVIYAYAFKMKGKTDNRYFIPYLAIFDLLACIIASSLALALNFRFVRFRGDILCKSIWFCGQLVVGCSGLLLSVISLQRYLKVCRPTGFQMTLPRKRAAIVGVIIVSAVSSAPTLVFYGEIELKHKVWNITGYTCGKKTHEKRTWLLVYTVFVTIMATACTLCLIIFYSLIGKTIYKQNKKLSRYGTKSLSNTSPAENSGSVDLDKETYSANHSAETLSVSQSTLPDENSTFRNKLNGIVKKATISNKVRNVYTRYKYSFMFLTITIVFIVAFAPWNVLTLLETIDPDYWYRLSDTETVAYIFLYRMYLINNVVNPFIYGFFDITFRKAVKRLLCRCRKPEIST